MAFEEIEETAVHHNKQGPTKDFQCRRNGT